MRTVQFWVTVRFWKVHQLSQSTYQLAKIKWNEADNEKSFGKSFQIFLCGDPVGRPVRGPSCCLPSLPCFRMPDISHAIWHHLALSHIHGQKPGGLGGVGLGNRSISGLPGSHQSLPHNIQLLSDLFLSGDGLPSARSGQTNDQALSTSLLHYCWHGINW